MERLLAACEKEGRDPATVRKSVQALFFIVPDDATAAKVKERAPADRAVVGTVEQINEAVAEYAAIGFDEVCVPDFTLGATPEARRQSYSTFMSSVASNFR
jgi:alkanesulfonate monooxygenase SsuD/methylene tetrahydromethanopterin reductase-like flavin-dependent oxidoreductase (luciferase family)